MLFAIFSHFYPADCIGCIQYQMNKRICLCIRCCTPGSRIESLTNVKLDDVETTRSVGEKKVMVRAARQLLSAITKVLILADRVVIKQLISAKDQVVSA